MGILFLVALVLAWPTYGLSVVAWLVVMFLKSQGTVAKSNERRNRKIFIEPLFTGRFADFFNALDIPRIPGRTISDADAHQCGRHIMNYIAHNSGEGVLFMQGLEKWRTKGDDRPCHPVTAATDERRLKAKGEIHLVSYRAIDALMTNNPNLRCFDSINPAAIRGRRQELESRSN